MVRMMPKAILLLLLYSTKNLHGKMEMQVSESVIFITGGYGSEDSSEVLDPEDSSSPCSRLTASLPNQRRDHSMSRLDDGEVVLCGGYNPVYTGTSCISTRSPGGPWYHHSQLTASRWGYASVVTGDTIHVLAGASPSRGRAESLEDGRWRMRGDLPYDMGYGACAVAVNHTDVFVTGGSSAMRKSAMWNPVTDQWTPLADMDQHGRSYHGCTLITRGGNVFVLVAGGEDDGSNVLSTSRVYHVEGNYWSAAGELNQGREAGVMVNTGERVYYIGGYGGNRLDSVEQFNIETNKWVNTNIKLKTARSQFAAVAVNKATFC